jgi:ATP-dependent RNA helicase DeaD
MDSFEDLGLDGALIEALSGEGIERPTPLQRAGIPVVRRGNNLVAHAGPGSGTLVTYGVALLDRLEPGANRPSALVVVPTAESARLLAEPLARIAQATGHSVASLGSPWVMPERADILFGTAEGLLAAQRSGKLALESIQALVVDAGAAVERTGALAIVETLLEYLPRECQRIVLSLPMTDAVADFASRHLRRAVHVPPEATADTRESVPDRGNVNFRIVDDPKDESALNLVAELFEAGARRVLLYFRSEDAAADAGDFLTLHGYRAGAPGEDDAPVWLAVEELPTLRSTEGEQDLQIVSYDVPDGPDSLDRRHGNGRGGTVVLLARELPHLRDTAKRTGYKLTPIPPAPISRWPGDLAETVEALERSLREDDLAPYLLMIDELMRTHSAAELAAAAVALLRKKAPAPTKPAAGAATTAPPVAWVKLFISLGEKDSITPRDLVGAITGEARIEGSKIGKVEVKDTFSLVEVEESVGEQVIRALNGTTIRGRSTRVDFDRARATRASGPRPGGSRPPGSRPPGSSSPGGPRKPEGRSPGAGPRGRGGDGPPTRGSSRPPGRGGPKK